MRMARCGVSDIGEYREILHLWMAKLSPHSLVFSVTSIPPGKSTTSKRWLRLLALISCSL